MGFELNPYADTCVANSKVVDGKQCTIAWYVDDNKISHVDPNVVTSAVNKIEECFGKMTVTGGKEHVFLGMHVTYSDLAEIRMADYLKEAISKFGENIRRATQAGWYLSVQERRSASYPNKNSIQRVPLRLNW
jgi:hypothetical protein